MAILLSDDAAEAALGAASSAAYAGLVQDLLKAGVRAKSFHGSPLILAESHGHADIAEILRDAIAIEESGLADATA